MDIADEKLEDSIFVVPLRLDDCLLPRRLRKWQFANYYPDDDRQKTVEKLIASLLIRANHLGIPNDSEESEIGRNKPHAGIRLEPKDDRDFEKPIIVYDSKLGFHPRPANQFLSSARIKLERNDVDASLQLYSQLIKEGVLLEFVIRDLEEATNNNQYPNDPLLSIFEVLSSAYENSGDHLKALHYQALADKYRYQGL